tara:strand:+ start:1063 stop:1560 length:498 start_codon:yes stop_codon:yes gene_type:complete
MPAVERSSMLSCELGLRESLEGREARPKSMADFDYESLLDRARENIPEEISSRSRWRLPAPQIMIEGSNTIFRNFNEVVSMMDRDENHVYQYILNELGTSGSRDGPRARFKGRIPPKRIKGTIANYVNTYIKCTQCGAPDTHFVKEDRTTLLKCQACGATRPVKL